MSDFQAHASGYRIKHLSDLTGVSRYVIRKWEQRYGILSPRRATNGYRVYAQELQLLFFLKHRMTTGLSIGRLARQGRAALIAEMNACPIDVPHVVKDSRTQARELIRAARRGDQAAVDQTISQLIQDWGFDRALTCVFFPILRTIGELWHQGRISIAGEHAISQTIKRLFACSHQLQNRNDQPQALVACVPNDFHEIGALSAVRFLRNAGWKASYLGPDTNVDVVRLACRRRHGKLVLFSCIVEPASDDMKRLLDDIVRHVLPLTTAVIMGGRGADAYRAWLKRRGIRHIGRVERVQSLTPHSLGLSRTT